MIKAGLTVAFAASVLLLGACHDAPGPANAGTPDATRSAPPAPSMAGTPATPPPISGGPATAPAPAETAKDSAATNPMATLTKDKESNAMPMAGQANNHSSESLEPGKAATPRP